MIKEAGLKLWKAIEDDGNWIKGTLNTLKNLKKALIFILIIDSAFFSSAN